MKLNGENVGKSPISFPELKEEDQKSGKQPVEVYFNELGREPTSLVKMIMRSIYENNRKEIVGVGVSRNGIQAGIQGIYLNNGLLYLHTFMRNKSSMPFDVDRVTFEIKDKKLMKKITPQTTTLKVLRTYNFTPRIVQGKIFRSVYCLEQFTLPEDQILVVTYHEKRGNRVVTYQLNSKNLLRAKTINELKIRGNERDNY